MNRRYSPKHRLEQLEKEKVIYAVKAAEKRLIENKVSLREKQKKFNELMSDNEQKGLRALEIEI